MKFTNLNIYFLLLMAMASPMMILYTVSAIGPLLIEELHFEKLYLSYLNIGSFGTAAVLSLFSRQLIEKIELNTGFLLLFFLVVISFFLMAVSPSIWIFLLVMPLIGLSQALANPLTNLFLKNTQQIQYKQFAVGVKQSGVQIGALIVGVFFPFVYLTYGREFLFMSIACLILLSSLYLFFSISYPSKNEKNNEIIQLSKIQYQKKSLYFLMAIQLLVGVVLSSFILHIVSYAVYLNMDIKSAGNLIGIFGLTGILARLIIPSLGDYLKSEMIIFMVLIVIAIASFLALICAQYFGNYLLIWAAIGIGSTLVTTNAIVMGLLIKYPVFGPVSQSSGWVSSMFFGGFALGPVISEWISIYQGNLQAIWEYSFMLLMIIIVLLIKMQSHHFLDLKEKSV